VGEFTGRHRPRLRQQLPSTARNTANADLFYDYGPVEFKIAGYYTSRVLFSPSLAVPSGAQDVYQIGASVRRGRLLPSDRLGQRLRQRQET